MTTWHDCPGKDSEQYPGKPGHVVSPDALAACNQCCQDYQDHGAVHADDHDHGADDHADGIYIDGAFLILIILLVQFYICVLCMFYKGEMTHQGCNQNETFGARHAWFGQARAQL